MKKQNLIQRKNISEQVFTHIKRMILSEELKGGEKITIPARGVVLLHVQ